MVMCDRQLIGPTDLGLEKRAMRRRVMTLDEARDAAEKQAIAAALRHTDRNITLAARQLGVSRVTLYRLLSRHDLS
jgi:transcriptional regulator of acetoin/glycerol metabolism